MLLRALRGERLKCRHSPVWIIFFILPIFPAVLGTFNYLGNLSILQSEWYSLWSQHTLFAACFFMPAQFGVFCAWQWRLEHTDHNWNSLMTAPVPVRDLYLSKLILSAGASVLAQVCIGVLFVISGRLAGIQSPLPPELPEWLLFGAVGGVAVCAVQLFLSLVLRAFAVPVALGLLGGIAGLLITAKGWGMVFPYALLCLGMRANNPSSVLSAGPFLLSCAVYIVGFGLLTVRLMERRDVTTG